MNITKISKTNFMGKIIDSHAHIGKHDRGCYIKSDLDVFVKSELPNKDTVEKMLVSDLDVLHGIKNEYEGNKLALETFKNNEKYSLLASCNPKDGEISNIKKLFKDYPSGFVGLKFHSDIQQLDLANKRGREPEMFYTKGYSTEDLSQQDLVNGGGILLLNNPTDFKVKYRTLETKSIAEIKTDLVDEYIDFFYEVTNRDEVYEDFPSKK